MTTKTNETSCHCSKTACGCAAPSAKRCDCGDRCECESGCKCGDDCECPAAK